MSNPQINNPRHNNFDNLLRTQLLLFFFFINFILFFVIVKISKYYSFKEYLPNSILFVNDYIENILPLISEYIPLIKETISNVYLALLN